MFQLMKNKARLAVASVAVLPVFAHAAGSTDLSAAVTQGASDFMANITANVPAILGVVALVAAVLLIIKLFSRR